MNDTPTNDLGIPGLQDAVEVGIGGFASVYRAYQPAFRRTVAVKVMATHNLDEASKLRFERECQAMGSLSEHPNIVTVYGAGFTDTSGGRPYMVMAYLPGGSLADRLEERGPFDWQTATEIGVELAGALETAHRAEVIHRDIKPANVLLSSYGDAQLTDFGIARISGGHETQSGVITASMAHAPPEVLDGLRPSVAADIYSLGSTLFELVHGQPAFEHDGEESLVPMLRRILTEPPPDLRPEGVPQPVWEVISRAMAKDPSARQSSALAFGRELQAARRAAGLDPGKLTIPDEPAISPDGAPGSVDFVTAAEVPVAKPPGADGYRSVPFADGSAAPADAPPTGETAAVPVPTSTARVRPAAPPVPDERGRSDAFAVPLPLPVVGTPPPAPAAPGGLRGSLVSPSAGGDADATSVPAAEPPPVAVGGADDPAATFGPAASAGRSADAPSGGPDVAPEPAAAGPAVTDRAPAEGAAASPYGPDGSAPPRRSGRVALYAILAVLVVLVLAGAAVFALRTRADAGQPAPSTQPGPVTSVGNPTTYSAEDRATFIQECTNGGGGELLCRCQYTEIEAKVPYERFVAFAEAARNGENPFETVPELKQIRDFCIQKFPAQPRGRSPITRR